MIRPFDWRDLALLHRLRDRGLCLDSEQAYTHGAHALQHALLGAFTPGGGTATLVARPSEPGLEPAIAQLLQRNGDPVARVTYFAPHEALLQPSGQSLLEGLCQAAGARGARNLIAEADEDSLAFEGLRQAGFAIYARQQIWRLPPQAEARRPGDSPQAERPPARRPRPAARRKPEADRSLTMWRGETSRDRPAIHLLYLNLVPALVQQIEPPPSRSGRGLVHWREGELLGYIELASGPRGIWIQPFFHPAAERSEELIAAFLRQLDNGRGRPVHACVRSYQGWMNCHLERLGFELCEGQAVMVKRLAAAARRPALAPLPALEGKQPEPTAPFAHWQDFPPAPGAGHNR
ncbi:MAG: hypothetical protein AB1449_03940 [Chloroflexota bacterium]